MIQVLKAGLSSIQDKGRVGFRAIGVPLSGVMDAHSASLANQLVGNTTRTAVIEFTAMGPTLVFEQDTIIAITGASFGVLVNDEVRSMNAKLNIKAGDILKITTPKKGWRGYIAVQGGFDSQVVLGSKSMYQGITEKGRIDKGDILKIESTSEIIKLENDSLRPLNFESKIIEIFKGPEYEILDKKTKENLEKSIFKIHQNSNRMATQIDGLGEVKFDDILTVPVQPGTVQLTPSGKLLILMKDAQTTGGYLRILQLTNKSLNILAQKRPQEVVTFKIIGA
ncbi:Allophanate hydrolase subunit 2 [unidentified eubacterium SCB49]|nr:Allophanate hydrolase subunit 2 [unidentified eubacterium SCB49]